jgi:DNA polymerase-3 subunit gamma/tau
MSYQVLARKYRPQRFSDVIGQDHVTRTLKNAIEQQRIAHGYIFSGHRGIGKTTIARILAMALNCRSSERPNPEPCGECDSCREIRAGNAVDVIEIDAATNRGIDEIRELRDAARYRPARDRYKIYILDEAHQITDAAFNALLKTLEEPPPHIIFMMATTQPEDIPQTIRSRCQNFNFHAVRLDDIVGQLRAIAAQESIQVNDEALAVLAEAGDGSMRDALSIMDQAIACCGGTLGATLVRGLVGTVGSEMMEDLMATVAHQSSEGALRLLDKVITEGQSPAHLVRQLVKFLRNVLVAKVSGVDSGLLQISPDERQRVGRVAAQFSEEDLTRFLQIMLRTHSEVGYRQEQRFHLELGVLKLVHAQRLLPLEQILGQVVPEGKASTPAVPPPVKVSASPSPSPSRATEPRDSPSPSPARTTEPRVSPFAADRARKGASSDPEMSAAEAPQVLAQAVLDQPDGSDDPGKILGRIVAELEQAGHGSPAMILESGSITIQGGDVIVTVAEKPAVIGLAFSPELLRVASGFASAAAGRPLKLSVVTGAGSKGNNGAAMVRSDGGIKSRGRAAEDPVVQRMQEKFGAEIRTIIDYRAKN